ncbi:MAG: zinc dependent phospholipase C family protein [Atopobiaceae bacterium]|jgi:hypothetical protein
MPALITHHLFGEETLGRLPEGLVSGQEELIAYLLGNQGPDPFFARFSTTPKKMKAAHALAHRMHTERVSNAFISLREAVSHLVDEDKRVGRAFTLGLVAHYVLDRIAHPFVYAQQYALCDALEDLHDAGSEVHAVIESDIDTWMLWQIRHATVVECPPELELCCTERVGRVAGALFSHVAWQVYGLNVGAAEYAHAVANYATLYRHVEPYGSAGYQCLTHIEHLFRHHSQVGAMAHQVLLSDECASANLNHLPWTDPATGAISEKSFADLFHDATTSYESFARAYIYGGGNNIPELVNHINYDGQIIDDRLM